MHHMIHVTNLTASWGKNAPKICSGQWHSREIREYAIMCDVFSL